MVKINCQINDLVLIARLIYKQNWNWKTLLSIFQNPASIKAKGVKIEDDLGRGWKKIRWRIWLRTLKVFWHLQFIYSNWKVRLCCILCFTGKNHPFSSWWLSFESCSHHHSAAIAASNMQFSSDKVEKLWSFQIN